MKLPRWIDPLLARLAADAPGEALLLAPPAHPVRRLLRERLPALATQSVEPGAVETAPRHRLAIVAGALESLDAPAAGALLAALRDRIAEQVVLWVDLERAPLDENALRALGFRLHARDGGALLCGYDAYDYKERPDWLNARHWAHPELWDRYRW